ncbi:hypothetical protein BX070DRAFT_93669 [Coemansia spiralis]|nr:hypothetical protein BX070DRAFT_93669 [Coemansia spiralis]
MPGFNQNGSINKHEWNSSSKNQKGNNRYQAALSHEEMTMASFASLALRLTKCFKNRAFFSFFFPLVLTHTLNSPLAGARFVSAAFIIIRILFICLPLFITTTKKRNVTGNADLGGARSAVNGRTICTGCTGLSGRHRHWRNTRYTACHARGAERPPVLKVS